MHRVIHHYRAASAVILLCLFLIEVSFAGEAGNTLLDSSLMNEFNHRINRFRKGSFVITIVDSQGAPIHPSEITLRQNTHEFRFGGSVLTPLFEEKPSNLKKEILLQRAEEMFNIVVDGNGFKWQNIEPVQGDIEYGFKRHQKSTQWAAAHGIALRHHCLFWEDPKFNPEWLAFLNPSQLKTAMTDRIQYTRNHARDDIRSLDVINELLYFRYYRDRVGDGIVKDIFEKAREAFPNARLYLNEFPAQKGKYFGCYDTYVDLIRKLKIEQVPFNGVGLQAHFDKNSIPSARMNASDFMRKFDAAIDKISLAAGLPVFITEYSMKSKDENLRADFLEAFYTMAFSNKNVEGILAWEWFDEVKDKALVKSDGSLTAAGERYYDLILSRWHTQKTFHPDQTGSIATEAFFGDYTVTIQKGSASCSEPLTLRAHTPEKITLKMSLR